jgi:hypothetical protein
LDRTLGLMTPELRIPRTHELSPAAGQPEPFLTQLSLEAPLHSVPFQGPCGGRMQIRPLRVLGYLARPLEKLQGECCHPPLIEGLPGWEQPPGVLNGQEAWPREDRLDWGPGPGCQRVSARGASRHPDTPGLRGTLECPHESASGRSLELGSGCSGRDVLSCLTSAAKQAWRAHSHAAVGEGGGQHTVCTQAGQSRDGSRPPQGRRRE